MIEIKPFLVRCARCQARREISRARLSTILFGSGKTLDRLHEGGGVTIRVLNRAVDRLEQQERLPPGQATGRKAA